MTGFGEAAGTFGGVEYAVEIRTVNNKYVKPIIRLPEAVQFAEAEVERLVKERIGRGTVTVNCRVRDATESAAHRVNRAALAAYVKSLTSTEVPAGAGVTIDLAVLATLPGVCEVPELDETDRQRRTEAVGTLVSRALDQVGVMRGREGVALCEDLTRQCEQVESGVARIGERAPSVVREYHARLADRAATLLQQQRIELDKDAISREVALYAERCDISEEIVRLRAHLAHFRETCSCDEPVGRKLEFISQEMLREANTIGSKSNDAGIARAVVELKTVIDRIKEQVLNAE
ncbi:MAG: YicC family protein [Phycisphaerales bacterium]|nr:YicC family protein [Phycisphaerales bacterium]